MSSSAESARVLVVDDEHVIREILADFLSVEGFWVRTAGDGEEALVELSKHRFDIVLSDLKMAKMDGLELLGAIRRHTPEVVVVLMTGFGTVETAIDAMKRGAYDYIMKPFKVQEVVQTLYRGLEKKRLEASNIRLREALSLYKVSEAIASSLSLDQILDTVVETAVDELHADHFLAYLDDGYGSFSLRREALSTTFCDNVSDTPTWTVDVEELKSRFDKDERVVLDDEGSASMVETEDGVALPMSLVAVPMRVRGRVIGMLVVMMASAVTDEGKRKVLQMIASRASAAIENARLYEDLQSTFRQTIRGLASAIDKMDRYTAGHSERVANYAQLLAIKLGLDESTVEVVRQSALMHDIGKIGCVLNLNKTGKLTQEEYETFQLHPGYGKDILEPISFLHPLIPGVHLHHERWDGDGYPLGLEKQDIPIVARIISVADTYDAMTSDRAYRRALPHEVAVTEIRRCAGSQFDPDCASEFLEALEASRLEKG